MPLLPEAGRGEAWAGWNRLLSCERLQRRQAGSPPARTQSQIAGLARFTKFQPVIRHPFHRLYPVGMPNFSNLIWTVVGVLAIVALLVWLGLISIH